jgi:uncharacterized protein (TIGR02246 family)
MADEYSAIRQLVERYADAVNRRDEADWAACWAGDAEWDLSGRKVQGRESIVGLWRGAMSNFPWVVQLVLQGAVERATGERTSGRWYLVELMSTNDGKRQMGLGVYRDSYVKVDGAWRFARRRYDLMYSGPPDLTGMMNAFPATS